MGKKYSQFYAENLSLSKPMDHHNERRKDNTIQTTGETTLTAHTSYTYQEQEKLGTQKHARIQRGEGGRGPNPPEKSKKYRIS